MGGEIHRQVEQLAEAFVMADIEDLRSLADLHTAFCELSSCAAPTNQTDIGEVCRKAQQKIEKIILDEADKPSCVLENLGRAVSNLQAVIRDKTPVSALSWPPEFAPSSLGMPEAAEPASRGNGVQTVGNTTEGPTAANPLEGDPSLLAEFVNEAREHLDAADINLLKLEAPADGERQDALNAVFRAFHTIKGVAGFLALNEIKTLSHEAENLLDKARKGELQLIGAAIDVTFDAIDMMKQLVSNVVDALETGTSLPATPSLPTLVERIRAVASGIDVSTEEEIDPPSAKHGEPLGKILLDAGAVTKKALGNALTQQDSPQGTRKLGEILVQEGTALPTHIEMALDVQQKQDEPGKMGEILVDMGVVSTDAVGAALDRQEKLQAPKLGQLLVHSGQVAAKDVAQALRAQSLQPQSVTQVREIVRVDADRLDLIIDTIGELVIAESMVCQSQDLRALRSAELMRSLTQLNKITRELQEMGTSLRMVPIRAVFQKMARLVRDLAKKAGKQVEFSMTGEDTELDKSVVDKIGDPLVHMIRNSVDHGLEATAEERVQAGKPPAGRISLRAFHKGGSIYIEIEDDGRGLDKKAILAKARDRGIVHEGETLNDHAIYNLIFEPGLSTARTITDVSGRGVGMDVVKRNIESLRGQIEIACEQGKGTVFSIRLPLTMAIIDGMVVSVGAEKYIIPTLSILTSIRPKPGEVSTVVGRGEVLSLQGQLLPLFRLNSLFDIDSGVRELSEGIVIVVEDDGRRAGFLVDSILGQQQTVIKSLGDAMQGITGIAGGAIMADGNVGLILDVSGMIRLGHEGPRVQSEVPRESQSLSGPKDNEMEIDRHEDESLCLVSTDSVL